jgi:beta-galactosidase GanA
MRHAGFYRSVLSVCALLGALGSYAAAPRLERQGTAMRLIVQNRPMLMLGGELGNSSASSAAYMAPHWPRLRQMHLNTVFAPVYWELIEPVEGRFDWTSVDSLIRSARANDLKLVLLWFGSWKNSMSTYVPAWIKRDQGRFPLAQLPSGESVQTLSAFASTTRDADARAFTALLAHLKATDQDANTVLMIQVENEIGMLPIAREHGAVADKLFQERVPSQLSHALGASKEGRWADVFGAGDAAAEIFMAWHYARFVEALVVAGKAAYALPMYVNAALNRTGKAPGEYPSGGPVPHLIEVWKAGAPSLDLLAPDIYFPNFVEIAARYRRPGNPFFTPEANRAGNAEVGANAFYAFGALDAIGFGPFSIESSDDPRPNLLSQAYGVLEQLSPMILENAGKGRMAGFEPRVLEDGTVVDEPSEVTLGNYRFTVSFVDTQSPQTAQNIAEHGGIIIQMGPEDYLVAGQGMIVTFRAVGEGPPLAGIDSAWEGTFDAQGAWVPGRRLNGDQTHQGRHLRLPSGPFQIQRVRLFRYR